MSLWAGPSLARRCLAVRAPLAHYRGDLLPEDEYEPWAETMREHVRRQALGLLDMCAASAAAVGELGRQAVRCLEHAIELAPDEEERYLVAAGHLLSQGRRGGARGMIQRARAVVEELGVRPSPAMIELEQRNSRPRTGGLVTRLRDPASIRPWWCAIAVTLPCDGGPMRWAGVRVRLGLGRILEGPASGAGAHPRGR